MTDDQPVLCPSCRRPADESNVIRHGFACPLRKVEAMRQRMTRYVEVVAYPGGHDDVRAQSAWESITSRYRDQSTNCMWCRILSPELGYVFVVLGEDRNMVQRLRRLALGFGGRLVRNPPPALIATMRARRWLTCLEHIGEPGFSFEIRGRRFTVDQAGHATAMTGGQG